MMNPNLPLIGMCKRCRRPAAGELVDEEFRCHQCLVPRGTTFQPTTTSDTTLQPNNWFYTFTTSNSADNANQAEQ